MNNISCNKLLKQLGLFSSLTKLGPNIETKENIYLNESFFSNKVNSNGELIILRFVEIRDNGMSFKISN